MKKYFTLDAEKYSIVEVFDNLKDIRKKYPEIDILDYIDDVEENYKGLLFITEDYIGNLISKTKEEENKSSLRDIISLKEDLDEKNEEYKQATIELENIHSEYVKLRSSEEQNLKEITDYKETIKNLETTKKELLKEKAELQDKLQSDIEEHTSKINAIKEILSFNYKKEIETELKLISNGLNDLELEILQYGKEG